MFDVKIVEFGNLCESGYAVSSLVEGVTTDGFVYNDTSQAEVEYGCVDIHQGEVRALTMTCTGMVCVLTLYVYQMSKSSTL